MQVYSLAQVHSELQPHLLTTLLAEAVGADDQGGWALSWPSLAGRHHCSPDGGERSDHYIILGVISGTVHVSPSPSHTDR